MGPVRTRRLSAPYGATLDAEVATHTVSDPADVFRLCVLPPGQAPAGILPVHRLFAHAERRGDLFPDDAVIAGAPHQRRLASFQFATRLAHRRQFGEHPVRGGGTLIERRPHEVNIC